MKSYLSLLMLGTLILGLARINPVMAFSFIDVSTSGVQEEILDVALGNDVLIMDLDESHTYAVFNPDDVVNSGMYCAYISGEELAMDNNLAHYGSCFVNDPGEFKVMELARDLPASYQDLKNSNYFVSEKIVRVLTFGQTYEKLVGLTFQQQNIISDSTGASMLSSSFPIQVNFVANPETDNLMAIPTTTPTPAETDTEPILNLISPSPYPTDLTPTPTTEVKSSPAMVEVNISNIGETANTPTPEIEIVLSTSDVTPTPASEVTVETTASDVTSTPTP